MEIKIGKVEVLVTNNGTPKAIVYPEGADFNNVAEGVELIGENDVLFLSTRKQGETIAITEKGKWKNVVIPNEYIQALNSPSYERVKMLFKRTVSGINKAINGTRTPLDLDTAKILITDNVELFTKVQDYIVTVLKNTDTEFATALVKDLKSSDTQARYKAWEVVGSLTSRNISEISKDYKIVNDLEEPKTKGVSKKSKDKQDT